MPCVFKLKLAEDTRRISLERPPSLDELKQITKQLFKINEDFIYKYEDDEKDEVSVTSDAELNEAIDVSARHFSSILRLNICLRGGSNTGNVSSQPAWNQETIRTAFASASSSSEGGPPNVSQLLTTLQAIGTSLPQENAGSNHTQQNSLQALSQLLTTFPWLNGLVSNMLSQPLQIPAGNTNTTTTSTSASGARTTADASTSLSSTSSTSSKLSPSVSPNNPRNKGQKLKHMGKFVKDVSVPDGTQFTAGNKFIKTWRMRNDGQYTWPEQTLLVCVGGDQLGEKNEVIVSATTPGQELDISVPMVAPSRPGRYNSFWRLCGPDGGRFGHRVWVDITVLPPMSPPPPKHTDAVATNTQQNTAIDTVSSDNKKDNENKENVNSGVVGAEEVVVKEEIVVEKITTDAEAEAVATLVDMGFSGDLLSTLRKNGSDLMRTLGDLMKSK